MIRIDRLMKRTLGHGLAVLFFVLLPAFVTLIAPVSWMRFERTDTGVRVDVRTCVFFVIPYRHEHIETVATVSKHWIAGKEKRRKHGQRAVVRSMSEGFLDLAGPEAEISVPISSTSAKSVTERVQAFLNDSTRKSLSLVVVGNWIVGVLFGSIFSLLTILYIVAVCWGIIARIRTGRVVRR